MLLYRRETSIYNPSYFHSLSDNLYISLFEPPWFFILPCSSTSFNCLHCWLAYNKINIFLLLCYVLWTGAVTEESLHHLILHSTTVLKFWSPLVEKFNLAFVIPRRRSNMFVDGFFVYLWYLSYSYMELCSVGNVLVIWFRRNVTEDSSE